MLVEPPKFGLGAAMAGGNPSAGRRPRDFYATPVEATIGLIAAETFEGSIHECCSGDGAMARVLEKVAPVVATDICPINGYGTKRDFFDIKEPLADNIVTNPPFKLAEKIIRHAMTHRPKKLALLLKSTFFHADTRHRLWKEFPPTVTYRLTWRLDFRGLKRPTMECAWFVWHAGNTDEPIERLMRKPDERLVKALLKASR